MRVASYQEYGPPDVVKIERVPKPRPEPDELLIKIVASTVNSGDWRARTLDTPRGFRLPSRLVFGWSGPRNPVLGMEFSGVVEAVGKDVTEFTVGDEVFASQTYGGHAEYRTLSQDAKIVRKPANVSFEQAAAISFGGTTALYFLRDRAKVQPGERVLIIGASGTVGSAAVQLAKHFGAEVTGVTSTDAMEIVSALGADHVIDYTAEQWTERGELYDVVIDTVGTTTFERARSALASGGRLALVVGDLPQVLKAPFQSMVGDKRVFAGVARVARADLQYLAAICEAGEFEPLIDRIYSLEDIVKAHAYVESGHKHGSVVISMT